MPMSTHNPKEKRSLTKQRYFIAKQKKTIVTAIIKWGLSSVVELQICAVIKEDPTRIILPLIL